MLKPSRRVLAVVALVTVVVGFVATTEAFHFFGLGSPNCWVRPSGPPNAAIFTVVMANQGLNVGFNGSKFHSIWPVMNVTLGQSVIIHVVNNDTLEAHGFAISRYFDKGLLNGLAPGKCYDVRFTADQLGSYIVQCNIFCSIHPYMQNGRLNVNP